MKSKTNLKLVESREGEQTALRVEEENRKLTVAEARARVNALRHELETYRDQIDAAAFDILSGEMPPRSLDHERRWAVDVIQDVNPAVKGHLKRCQDQSLAGDAFQLMASTGETAFMVGTLWGLILSGCSKETIDRFERGLVHALCASGETVKEQ